jgi:excisionase family DNA binding protein
MEKKEPAEQAIVLMDWNGAEPLDLVERIRRSKSALTAEQLAGLLGCTSGNIYRKAKRGKIPSYRIGGAVKFDPVRTADWLQNQSMGDARIEGQPRRTRIPNPKG